MFPGDLGSSVSGDLGSTGVGGAGYDCPWASFCGPGGGEG